VIFFTSIRTASAEIGVREQIRLVEDTAAHSLKRSGYFSGYHPLPQQTIRLSWHIHDVELPPDRQIAHVLHEDQVDCARRARLGPANADGSSDRPLVYMGRSHFVFLDLTRRGRGHVASNTHSGMFPRGEQASSPAVWFAAPGEPIKLSMGIPRSSNIAIPSVLFQASQQMPDIFISKSISFHRVYDSPTLHYSNFHAVDTGQKKS
jgi:hypothetical protein